MGDAPGAAWVVDNQSCDAASGEARIWCCGNAWRLKGHLEHARAGMWLGKGKQQQPYSRQPELATSLPRGEDRSSIMLSGGL